MLFNSFQSGIFYAYKNIHEFPTSKLNKFTQYDTKSKLFFRWSKSYLLFYASPQVSWKCRCLDVFYLQIPVSKHFIKFLPIFARQDKNWHSDFVSELRYTELGPPTYPACNFIPLTSILLYNPSIWSYLRGGNLRGPGKIVSNFKHLFKQMTDRFRK